MFLILYWTVAEPLANAHTKGLPTSVDKPNASLFKFVILYFLLSPDIYFQAKDVLQQFCFTYNERKNNLLTSGCNV